MTKAEGEKPTHYACMQAAFALVEALGVEERPFCSACEHEPEFEPVEDRCPECGAEGFMSLFYGPSEKRLQENDLADIVASALAATDTQSVSGGE